MSDCRGHVEDVDLGVMGRATRVWHPDGCIPVHDDEGRYTHHADTVAVPVTGTYLVTDGVVRRVHEVRKEADYQFNRCEPGDICGAEDGCNDQ